MRFSLLALIGSVALAAVGCAALVIANDAWLVAVSTVTFAIVTVAVIAGLVACGRTQAFAGGFAVACLAYLVLVYFALANENAGNGQIVTTRLLEHLWRAVANGILTNDWNLEMAFRYSPDDDHFMQIGQQQWALLIGCLGGAFASYISRHRPSATTKP